MLRTAAAGAGLFLLAAHGFAQNVPGGTVTLTWSTQEIVASTGAPSPSSPGVIEPGEGVRFTLGTAFAPPVGTQFQWFGHQAEVTGWAGSLFRFLGTGDTHGVFSRFSTPAEVEYTGDPGPAIIDEIDINVFQRGAAGEPDPINPANPFQGVITFDWVPAAYTPRTVSFRSEDGITAGEANALAILITTPSGPSRGAAGAAGIHTSIEPILIVPAPPAAPALLLAPFLRTKRRRLFLRRSVTA